jgi:DNA-directed RNA polymerase specialized sigma subunit
MSDPAADKRDASIAKALGISRQTIRNWKNHPELKKMIHSRVSDYTSRHMPEIWQSLIDSATDGDVQAARLIFQLRGELEKKEKPVTDSRPPEVKITFLQASPRQKEGADQ